MSCSQDTTQKNDERQTDKSLLVAKDISAFYGDAQVLKDICLSVNDNEIVAVLGSNGAGKTTLLKALTGLMKIRSGKITFSREPIANLPPIK